MSPVLGFVLKGYPRLSETFIANEILGLEQQGLRLRLFSMRRPTDPAVHPVHRRIRAPVVYLPEYLHEEPRRVWRAWHALRRRAGYNAARTLWLKDLRRDPTRNRIRRFGQALVLAHELPPDVGWLHAHFLHTPASVTRYAAALTGLPWSVSAHAKDVWTTPEWEKREKLNDCRWLVTCTGYNARHLSQLAPQPERVELVYHGLDEAWFDGRQPPGGQPTGSDSGNPIVFVSVGRAVEKKGYDVLLAALARLPSDITWRMVHIGGGPLLATLQETARRLGLGDRIRWRGAQPQDAVMAAYRASDVFVLSCRVAADGDRDGLPNVLMEAQSQGLACVSTTVSAIPELIVDGETGLLVPPDDPQALAGALENLCRSPKLRLRLGLAGQRRVRSSFNHEAGVARLAQRFRGQLAGKCETCGSLSTHP